MRRRRRWAGHPASGATPRGNNGCGGAERRRSRRYRRAAPSDPGADPGTARALHRNRRRRRQLSWSAAIAPRLEAACEEATARGAKRAVSLRVAVPSHTPLLVEATEQFRAILRKTSPRLPSAGYRLLSGIDGDTIHDMETGIDKLARQISTTIDWAACLESCRSAGAEAAVELGPGTALRSYGVGAVPRWPCPRSGGIPHLGRTADMAATGDGLMQREGAGSASWFALR